MPAVVMAGTAGEIRRIGTGSKEAIDCALLVQFETVREALRTATAAFTIPKIQSKTPHMPSARGIPIRGSSVARGSNSRKDGTVNAVVIAAAAIRGNIRTVKSRSATRRTGRCPTCTEILRQASNTANERKQ